MPDVHARLSPSAAERWINCPGSIHLSEQCPDQDSDSDYTKEGTVAHSLCEIKLKKFNGELKTRAYNSELKSIKESGYYDGEMEEASDFYLTNVTEIFNGAGDDAELLVEQQFKLDKYVPGSFGTSDAVVIGNNKIEIIDFKYGKGVKVSAKENPQLRLYGLGTATLFGGLYDFDTVRLTIIQPRLDWVSTEEIKLSDLVKWANDVVVPQANKAAEDADEYEGDSYTIKAKKGRLKITYGEMCRGDYAYAFCITDVYGDDYITDAAEFHINKYGEISFYE